MILQVGLLLLLLSWVQPLHLMPWMSWHSEMLSFAALSLLAARGLWLAWRGTATTSALPFPALAWVFLGLLLLVGVQTLAGQIVFAGDALVLGLYLLLSAGALALGAASAPAAQDKRLQSNQPDALVLLASTLLLGALLSSVAALVQLTGVWDGADWINRTGTLRRPGGNLGQPNQLGTLLLMGLVSLVYLWEKGKLGRSSALLILVVLATGVTVTESRASQLSMLALVVWWLMGRRRIGFKLGAGALLVAAGLSMAAFWLWPQIVELSDTTTGAGQPASQAMLSGGGRWIVWPQLWEAVLLHPWAGWGLREVSTAHNAVAHAYSVSEPYAYSHNLVLDMALGMGLPLTIVLVSAGVYGLWRRMSAAQSLNAWYCVAAIVPVLVHSMFEFPYAYAYFLAPVMFLLGRLEAEVLSQASMQIKRGLASVLFIVACALGASTVLEYVEIEEDFLVARFEVLRLGQTPEAYVRPKIHLLTQLGALLEGARLVPKPDMGISELELARRMALRFPWPATQNRYALSLALNGQPEEARRQLQVMRAQYRHKERIYASVKEKWLEMAQTQYPQLRDTELP